LPIVIHGTIKLSFLKKNGCGGNKRSTLNVFAF
jgi:hypothetical protein